MKWSDRAKTGILWLLLGIFCVLVLPILLLYLLYKVFAIPFDYMKYKRSRYQQDFPHRFSFLDVPHVDNAPYTAIKENDLPVEYIKWSEDYELSGYFLYRDILLVFDEPFFYDRDDERWASCSEAMDKELTRGHGTIGGDDDPCDVDYCLTVQGMKELVLDDFHARIPDRVCNRVVFFCMRKHMKGSYLEGISGKLIESHDFIMYEKGELAMAIMNLIEHM